MLKDNDMHIKISLEPSEAKRMLGVLHRDSDLLGRLGVIDYSLLVGVKKWKFPVSLTDEQVSKYIEYGFFYLCIMMLSILLCCR